MAKRRRAGQRHSIATRQQRPKKKPRVFVPEGAAIAEEPALDNDAASSDSEASASDCLAKFATAISRPEQRTSEALPHQESQPRVLDSLTSAELVATYGKGFALLQRMGFVAGPGGLRSDCHRLGGSLSAPLRVLNKGRSRKGVQGEDENRSAGMASSMALGASKSMNDLLQEVLASMEDVGDLEEAEELRALASCVGLEGSFGAMQPPQRKRRRETAIMSDASTVSADEREALAAVMQNFHSDADFPVELREQAKHLLWNKRRDMGKPSWQEILGNYETFIERHDELLQIVRCPAPHGTLVLPCTAAQSDPWIQDRRYQEWCHNYRVAASGKLKKKWKHVERTVARLCRGKQSTLGSESDGEPKDVPVKGSVASLRVGRRILRVASLRVHAAVPRMVPPLLPSEEVKGSVASLGVDAAVFRMVPPPLPSEEVEALDWCEDTQGSQAT